MVTHCALGLILFTGIPTLVVVMLMFCVGAYMDDPYSNTNPYISTLAWYIFGCLIVFALVLLLYVEINNFISKMFINVSIYEDEIEALESRDTDNIKEGSRLAQLWNANYTELTQEEEESYQPITWAYVRGLFSSAHEARNIITKSNFRNLFQRNDIEPEANEIEDDITSKYSWVK